MRNYISAFIYLQFLLISPTLIFAADSSKQSPAKAWKDYSLMDKFNYYLLGQTLEKGVRWGFGSSGLLMNDDECVYKYDDHNPRTLTFKNNPSCNGKTVKVCQAKIECTTILTNGSKYTFEVTATCPANPLCPSNPKECITAPAWFSDSLGKEAVDKKTNQIQPSEVTK